MRWRARCGGSRGEGEDGMQAVANVICNRAAIAQARAVLVGNDIIRVCQAGHPSAGTGRPESRQAVERG